ncbi:hypothetical protein [Anaerocolumna xylanovorans]|uniref:Uncharacterized protein n=1 Tax=Anaerocolumna xylanovorans DSM 12503 TaxID=1121345 RepID=A0A1M7Y8P4_9FIRM|nr:hypothetical protein [Anaerocolumna xylanovorans]SHO48916.1 hypothetical protein SAMN02745217_02095 [Anaerocolumna xylanovorans DSM 12503]
MNGNGNITDSQNDIPDMQIALKKQHSNDFQTNKILDQQEKMEQLVKEYKLLYIHLCFFHYKNQIFEETFSSETLSNYFYHYKNRLFYTGNNMHTLIEVKDTLTFFSILGLSSFILEMEDELVKSIKLLIKTYNFAAESHYQHLVRIHKIENNIQKEFYLDNPVYKFFYINKTLYGLLDNRFVCLTQRNIKAINKQKLGTKYDEAFWTKLVSYIPKELERQTLLPPKIIRPNNFSMVPEDIRTDKSEYIYASVANQNKIIIYDDTSKRFIAFGGNSITVPNQIMLSSPEIIAFSETLVHLLYYIFGDIGNISNYSKFITSCESPVLLMNKLFILSGTSVSRDIIREFTLNILAYGNTTTISRKGKLAYYNCTDNIPSLLEQHLETFLYYNELDISSVPKTYDLGNIRKMILGKNIFKTDVIMKKINYINTMPFVYYSTNQKMEHWFQTHLPCQILEFKGLDKHIDIIQHLIQSMSRNEWIKLKTFFSLQGLKLLSLPKKTNVQQKSEPISYTLDDALDIFLTEYCISDTLNEHKGFFTYGEDLYNSYVTFIEKNYKFDPVKKGSFIKAIKAKEIYEYKKPRASRSDNKYAFIGIQVNQIKLQSPTELMPVDDNLLKLKEFVEEFEYILNDIRIEYYN